MKRELLIPRWYEKNDQILGGLESEVCSWRTIMTLIGGLVALEWKMGMEKKKKGRNSCRRTELRKKAEKGALFSREETPP